MRSVLGRIGNTCILKPDRAFARRLGTTVSDQEGKFSQDFNVPGDLDLATYEIYLSTPEDATYNAALSN